MSLLTGVNETTRSAMENIMDTFTGVDGGAKYVKFTQMIVQLDRQAKQGDRAAGQLLDFINCTSKLIDQASKNEQQKSTLQL